MRFWKPWIRGTVFALIAWTWAQPSPAQPPVRVADLNSTREDLANFLLNSQPPAVLGTTVFFVHDDGIHGPELWKTDGAPAGTVMVKDVCPGACSSFPSSLTPAGGFLFFGADDGVHGADLMEGYILGVPVVDHALRSCQEPESLQSSRGYPLG